MDWFGVILEQNPHFRGQLTFCNPHQLPLNRPFAFQLGCLQLFALALRGPTTERLTQLIFIPVFFLVVAAVSAGILGLGVGVALVVSSEKWMCSFLLLFLIFVVTFTFLQDFSRSKIQYLAEEGQAPSGYSTQKLVSAQVRENKSDLKIIDSGSEYFLQASFEGLCISQQNFIRDPSQDGFRRSLPMGLSMWTTEQKVSESMCDVLGALDKRLQTRCYSKEKHLCSRHPMEQLMGGLGRVARKLENLIGMGGLGRVRQCWKDWFSIPESKAISARCLFTTRSNGQEQRQGKVERKREAQRRAGSKSVCTWQRSFILLAAMAKVGDSRCCCLSVPVSPVEQEFHDARDGISFASGLQRKGYTHRSPSILGQGGQGVQQEQYQIASCGYKELRSCPESTQRRGQCEKGSQTAVDKTCQRGDQDLGSATGKLSSSPSDPRRACKSCKGRNRSIKENSQGGERQYSKGGQSLDPTADSRRNRGCSQREQRGPRGAEIERSTPGCSERMRWLPGTSIIGSGGSCRDLRRGQRAAPTQQKAKIGRTGETYHCHFQTVTLGRELPVHKNGTHEAWPHMFPNGHSVMSEWNYASPITSVWSAWKLRGEVLHDVSQDSFMDEAHCHCLCSVAHQFSDGSLKSILSSSQGPHYDRRKSRRVRFDDRIELALVLDDECRMHHIFIEHIILQEWDEKPWKYTPKPPSRKYSWRRLTNLSYPFCDFSAHCEDRSESVNSCGQFGVSCTHDVRLPDDEQSRQSSFAEPHWIMQLNRIIASLPSSTGCDGNLHGLLVNTWIADHENHKLSSMSRVVCLGSASSTWHDQVVARWSQELRNPTQAQIHVVPWTDSKKRRDRCVSDLIVVNDSDLPAALVEVISSEKNCMQSITFATLVKSASLRSFLQQFWNVSPLHRLGDGQSIKVVGDDNLAEIKNGARFRIWAKTPTTIEKSRKSVRNDNILCDITNLELSKAGQLPDSSVKGGDPLSILAVSISPLAGKCERSQIDYVEVEVYHSLNRSNDENTQWLDDEMSVMQTGKKLALQCKNAPTSLQREDIIQVIQNGQDFQGGDDSGSDVPEDQSTEGYSPGDNSEPAEQHHASVEESRQEVILFHLEDYPIRTFVSWDSYEQMITEIAHHYGLSRDEVEDVYEVAVAPPDIGNEVVPTVVHVFGDIPHQSTERLVLIDIEYHAHRIEGNFRSGPNIFRSVKAMPMTASRNEVLYRVNIDRYCRSEDGRCLVFINARRWPDYDEDKKVIAHGDYIRVAVPPSERFACPTVAISDMVQRRFSDQQILDEIYNEEAASGFSPSLLEEEEIRQLATDHLVMDDESSLMQTLSEVKQSDAEVTRQDRSDGSSTESVEQDWFIDLQRIVEAHFQQCSEEQQNDFMFSVYTWFIDQEVTNICREPKIAILGDDPGEWREDILLPWEYHLVPGNAVLIDLVQPFTRRISVEEHIAHVIITQRPNHLNSVLFSIEFVDEVQPNVVVAFAAAVPRIGTARTFADSIPLFERFFLNRRHWIYPEVGSGDHEISTNFGLGIQVQIFADTDQDADEESSDVLNLLEVYRAQGSSSLLGISENDSQEIVDGYEGEGNALLRSFEPAVDKDDVISCKHDAKSIRHSENSVGTPSCETVHFQNIPSAAERGVSSYSLTDEFIRYVQAVGSAGTGGGPQVDVPPELDSQPVWVQDLWEKWTDTMAETGQSPQEGLRLETWFSNPRRWTRCRESRIVVLSPNFQQWERELLSAWPDKAEFALPTQIAIVFPLLKMLMPQYRSR